MAAAQCGVDDPQRCLRLGDAAGEVGAVAAQDPAALRRIVRLDDGVDVFEAEAGFLGPQDGGDPVRPVAE